MFNLDNIPLDDKQTYDLICDAKTKGLFQAESFLCQKHLKMIKPRTISEISDVIAIIRPGAIQQAEEYVAVKDGDKKAEYLDDRLKDILDETNSIILYQEQTIKIAQVLAGFTEIEADVLRKAIGKKKMDQMKELRPKFVAGCINNGVKEEIAEHLMDIIIESGNYSFNKSHSYSYAINMYKSAYLKAHYPLAFFLGLLQCARQEQKPMEEISQIFYDMKSFGLNLTPPKINNLHKDFEMISATDISFGIDHVKRMGTRGYKELTKLSHCETWRDFLFEAIKNNTNKTVVEVAILSGILDDYIITRRKMLAEFSLAKMLTPGQKNKLLDFVNDVEGSKDSNLSTLILNLDTDTRVRLSDKIKQKCDELVSGDFDDDDLFKDANERAYFGINITSNRISDYQNLAKDKCSDIMEASRGNFEVCAVLEKVKTKVTKRGDTMAFISFSDETGKIDQGIMFGDVYKKSKMDKDDGECSGVVILSGYKKADKDCFFIKELRRI